RWATLTSSEQYCSGYGSVEQVVADDLSDVPVQIKAVTTRVVRGAPCDTVQVTVTYSHTLLFGVTDTQLVFRGSSTMPGTVATPAACPNCCPTPIGRGLPTATLTTTPTLPTPTTTPTITDTPTI